MTFDADLSPAIMPDEIRAAREELGWTQRQLGDVLGVDHTTVSRWELGAIPCGIPGAVKYALEYFRLRQWLLDNEVFQNLDESLEDLAALRDKVRDRLARERATLRKGID